MVFLSFTHLRNLINGAMVRFMFYIVWCIFRINFPECRLKSTNLQKLKYHRQYYPKIGKHELDIINDIIQNLKFEIQLEIQKLKIRVFALFFVMFVWYQCQYVKYDSCSLKSWVLNLIEKWLFASYFRIVQDVSLHGLFQIY